MGKIIEALCWDGFKNRQVQIEAGRVLPNGLTEGRLTKPCRGCLYLDGHPDQTSRRAQVELPEGESPHVRSCSSEMAMRGLLPKG